MLKQQWVGMGRGRQVCWAGVLGMALVWGAGCSDSESRDDGGSAMEGTSNGTTSNGTATTPDQGTTEMTLVELQASVFTPSCAFEACHGGANPKNDLDLSSVDASLAALVGVAGVEPDTIRVVAGDPEASLLLQTLEGPVGAVRQMPLGFEASPEMVAAVRRWIEAGAPRGEGEPMGGGNLSSNGVVDDPNAPKPEDLVPPLPDEGFQMGITTMAPAGEEIWKCWVEDLPLDGLTAVNRVEVLQTPGVHHMDIMALGLLGLPIEPGMHDCDDLYNNYQEMMEDGLFIFASQEPQDELILPPGTAAVLPGRLQIMVEVHYVNPTPRDVEVWSRVNAYTMPMNDVEKQIWGSAARDVDINVPAGVDDWVEWTRCVLTRDIEMILISSHSHELSQQVDIYTFDGTDRGELIYTDNDWHAPKLLFFDEPVPVPAGTGFEWRCFYKNPKDHEVNWGFSAEDEMCQIAIVHTPFDPAALCEVVDSGAGPASSLE
ncbi:MAG: hypothetical protein AAFX99_23815 [Myxococcota bacterium]